MSAAAASFALLADAPARAAVCAGYEAQLHHSIAAVACDEWDSILAPGDALHSHAFLLALEEAQVEDAEFHYLTIRHGGRLVATAALSAFDAALDLMVTGLLRRFIDLCRHAWPRLLKVRVLFCGMPASLGQRNVVLAEPRHAQAVAQLLAQAMETLARERGIGLLCVKELRDADAESLRGLEAHGFFRAASLPYMELDLRWESFARYLDALRHSYRRKIRQSLAQLGRKLPRVLDGAHGFAAGSGIYLLDPAQLPPARFHRLYLEVMRRADTRLELLNERFFERIYARLGDRLRLLGDVRDGEIRAAALILCERDTMTFLLFGQEAANRAEDEHYFNMLCGILEFALRERCRVLRLGQTTYWFKQQIGAEARAEHLYLRARARPLNALLRRLKHALFPLTRLIEARVFKDNPTTEVRL